MQYIEAPSQRKAKYVSVFLAGGITNCQDWQTYVVDKLKNEKITIFNPRRKNFPIGDSGAAKQQIDWEYERLRLANINSFWFPKETSCPIVLFELGSALEREKPLAIGTDPEYARKIDVEIQTEKRRPDLKIYYTLDELTEEIRRLAKKL